MQINKTPASDVWAKIKDQTQSQRCLWSRKASLRKGFLNSEQTQEGTSPAKIWGRGSTSTGPAPPGSSLFTGLQPCWLPSRWPINTPAPSGVPDSAPAALLPCSAFAMCLEDSSPPSWSSPQRPHHHSSLPAGIPWGLTSSSPCLDLFSPQYFPSFEISYIYFLAYCSLLARRISAPGGQGLSLFWTLVQSQPLEWYGI